MPGLQYGEMLLNELKRVFWIKNIAQGILPQWRKFIDTVPLNQEIPPNDSMWLLKNSTCTYMYVSPQWQLYIYNIQVSRNASAYVNIQDDNGVLVGNWSGDYSGGKSPLEWSGSAEILSQFNRYKQPVRFAQCWVFSGVLTTGTCNTD